MQKFALIIFFIVITLWSCNNDDDTNNTVSQTNITLNFSHIWDDTAITNHDFNTVQYTNEKGDHLSITKLRYLISNITFQKPDGEKLVLDGYNLVDVTNGTNLSFTPSTTIPTGDYSKVLFTFGFNNNDNYNTNYPDLNTALWSVPTMLGGGYHYMQLEGKFIGNARTETGYAYHAIRAVDNTGTTQVFQDTFFEVDLGPVTITDDATFEIDMNIAEWFKNPHTWDLNILGNMLMPNFDAQVMMFDNGQNVFSLKSVNQ